LDIALNHLAHLYLSGNDPLLRIGNLAGDFVKGVDTAALHPIVQQGIALHTAVDAYTDSHATVQQSKTRIGPPYRRFAGVLIDVFYDHFLAANWDTYSRQPLEEYIAEIYADLQTHRALLPLSLQNAAPRMIAADWLTSYRDIDGIALALTRLERRLRHKTDLASSIDELKKNHAELEQDFAVFFPQLITHIQNHI
jgi:acyl carrier protein phosphodiesterase